MANEIPKKTDPPKKDSGEGSLSEVKKDREERQKREAQMRELEENLKPGQILTKDQLEEERKKAEGKDATKATTDMHGNTLEAGSLVQIAARVTKAEDGKIDVEFVDPDPEAKKITAAGIASTTTRGTDINPRIGANPQKRGPGIREVLAKEGGIKPVAKTQEDDKSVQDLPVLTAVKSSTLTPVEEKPAGTKKAA